LAVRGLNPAAGIEPATGLWTRVRYGSQPVNDDEKVLNSGGFFRIAKAIG
jgi:hypothetical protein